MNALLLVDLQNDFLPGGALAVPRGDEVIGIANRLQQKFSLVVATQDWHPANHGSFASQHPGRTPGERGELAGLPQVFWPDHCVQDTAGAALAKELDTRKITRVFQKGTDPAIDSYSGFFDHEHRKATGLGPYLQEQRVTAIYLLGLATDYCVRATALDARELAFEVFLVTDACRAVELKLGDSERSLAEMHAAGVHLVTSESLLPRGLPSK